MKRWLLPAMVIIGFTGAWQLAASSGVLADLLNLESFLVPSPAEIAESLWQSRALLAENTWITLREMLLGLSCAVIVGVAFAVALHLSENLRLAFYPLIIASQTVPIIVIAPILVVWFGYGIGPKLAIVALLCFFPIALNTYDGLRSVDPEATKMMRSLDASRAQILWRVDAPSSLPYFFSGTRIAVAFAAIAAVFGEWAGSDSGLGHLMLQDNAQLETARLFAAVLVLSVMAVGLVGLVALAERRVVNWR